MNIKIKKISIKMSIVMAVFIFACNSRNRPPTLADTQLEHTSSVATADTVTEIREDNTKNADTDSIPRNTEWADAEGKPRYGYFDVYGQRHSQNYGLIDEKPLFNGNDFIEEFRKYFDENNKFKEIAKEYNIQTGIFSFEFTIETDGSIIATPNDFADKLQAFTDEIKRIINIMHEQHGKCSPGKHGDEVVKTIIPAWSFNAWRQ